MDIDIGKLSHKVYRVETFNGSPFEQNSNKCTIQNMADAGFYFTPKESESDMVTCYACGREVFSWDMTKDDPWVEHKRVSQDCLYLKKKGSCEKSLTVNDYIEIEKYRFLRLNQHNYRKKRRELIKTIDKMIESTIINSDEENNSPDGKMTKKAKKLNVKYI